MYVELDPHPGGADYFLLEEILRIRACLGCRSRPAECATTRDVAVLFDGRLIDAARGCIVYTRPCAHVGVMSSDFDDGSMLYDVRGGQVRRNSGISCRFKPDNTIVLHFGPSTPTWRACATPVCAQLTSTESTQLTRTGGRPCTRAWACATQWTRI